jgi:hypothetical protein
MCYETLKASADFVLCFITFNYFQWIGLLYLPLSRLYTKEQHKGGIYTLELPGTYLECNSDFTIF